MTQASPIASARPSLFMTPTEAAATFAVPVSPAREVVVRRPTPEQGMALEVLGHAIEYLVDTNFYHQRAEVPAVREAIAMLKQSSREVFAEAPEVVPVKTRAARWLRSRLQPGSGTPAEQAGVPARLFLVKR